MLGTFSSLPFILQRREGLEMERVMDRASIKITTKIRGYKLWGVSRLVTRGGAGRVVHSGRMGFSNHSVIFAKSSLGGLSTTSWLRVQRNSPRRAVDKMNCPGVEVSFFNLIFCNSCPFLLANKQTNKHTPSSGNFGNTKPLIVVSPRKKPSAFYPSLQKCKNR